MSRYLHISALFVLALVACLALPGCGALAAVVPVLTDVIAKVTDGMQLLDQIASFVDRYFAVHPNPAKQQQVNAVIDKARSTLNVALRTSRGAKELTDEQADAAFADFKVAYQEVRRLVGSLEGVRVTAPGQGQLMLAAGEGETLSLPEPLAFKGKP